MSLSPVSGSSMSRQPGECVLALVFVSQSLSISSFPGALFTLLKHSGDRLRQYILRSVLVLRWNYEVILRC